MRYFSFFFLFNILTFQVVIGQTMKIDEDFSDWSSAQLAHTDVVGDGLQNSIDFGKLWISDDEQNIYFHIELGKEIELQEFEDLYIYVDVDNNLNTGVNAQNIGADFVYRFGQRNGFLFINGNFINIGHDDIDLVSLPTVSSDKFEFSFSKEINYSQGSITLGSTINLAFVDIASGGDRMPNSGAISYQLTAASFTPPPYHLDKSNPDDLRILSYNVLQDGLFEPDRQPAFSRIFQALQPDIICFQEIYNYNSADVAQVLETMLPSGQNETWFHSDVNPDAIIISRHPITSTNFTDGNGIFELSVADQQVILVNAHLPCCNNERDRQLEVDRLMSFIRNSKSGVTNLRIENNAPIFILGDMNLVGDRRQQITLVSGDIINENLYGVDFDPDWDGTALDDALPFVTGTPHAVTWYNPFGSFSAGRLDYMLYSGSVVELQNAFALNTENLTTSELDLFNLQASDTYVASDHFPCVMDVTLDALSNITTVKSNVRSLDIVPNPASDLISFKIRGQNSIEKIEIRDINGRIVQQIEFLNDPSSTQLLRIEFLSSGVYFIYVIAEDQRWIGKFLKT